MRFLIIIKNLQTNIMGNIFRKRNKIKNIDIPTQKFLFTLKHTSDILYYVPVGQTYKITALNEHNAISKLAMMFFSDTLTIEKNFTIKRIK